MTFVFKSKGQNILQDFWKEDVIQILSDVISGSSRLFKGGHSRLKNVSLKDLPRNLVSSGKEVMHISRVMPGRMKKALSGLQSDMLNELDLRSDSKEKALFCLKVFGVLSSSTFTTLPNIPALGKELSLGKIRVRSAFAKFILAELIFRFVSAFLRRFLNEVERELTEEADLAQLRYFRRVLDGGEAVGIQVNSNNEDSAFRMADKFRNTIFNGDDESRN